MQHEVDIDYDLENSPLQIKTDSLIGTDEKVYVSFNSAGGDQAGGVRLHLTSPPRYALVWCHRYTSLLIPTSLPTETDKIWTITLSRSTAGIRLTIQCNNKEVLDVELSSTFCDDTYWSSYWSKDVKKIRFTSSDTASDSYRPGK